MTAAYYAGRERNCQHSLSLRGVAEILSLIFTHVENDLVEELHGVAEEHQRDDVPVDLASHGGDVDRVAGIVVAADEVVGSVQVRRILSIVGRGRLAGLDLVQLLSVGRHDCAICNGGEEGRLQRSKRAQDKCEPSCWVWDDPHRICRFRRFWQEVKGMEYNQTPARNRYEAGERETKDEGRGRGSRKENRRLHDRIFGDSSLGHYAPAVLRVQRLQDNATRPCMLQYVHECLQISMGQGRRR